MRDDLLLRSFMFVPALNRRFIDKGLASRADAIILDLEDSVPPDKRGEARANLEEYAGSGLLSRKTVFVRVNEVGTADFAQDVFCVMHPDVDGLMPSKVRSASDIEFLDRLLSVLETRHGLPDGKLMLAPLVETTGAVADIHAIAHASGRLVALCFGGEDYLDDLESTYTYQTSAFAFPRASIANAARSAGLLPIDTPYLEIADVEGYKAAEREAYKVGFAGSLVLNPRQIDAANEVFSPSPEEVEYSRGVIAAIEQWKSERKSGVAMFDGVMVGPPMRTRAYRVMDQVRRIEALRQREEG